VIENNQDEINTKITRESVELDWHANPVPLHDLLAKLLAEDSGRAPVVAERWLFVALCERDYDAAQRAVTVLTPDGAHPEGFPFPLTWCKGVVAKARGDESAARTSFLQAREEVAKVVREQPRYAEAICTLGVLDAAVGDKESAVKNAERAIQLFAPTRNAIEGALALEYLALIYAWTGEKAASCKTLAESAKTPGGVTFGELRLHPFWDPLRGDPRFDKIVASLAPK
jgi:hypothetical protein